MFARSNLRLYLKWLKIHSACNQVGASNLLFCASVQRGHLHATDFSQFSGKSHSWHRSSINLSEVGSRKLSSGSVPPLSVGAKAVINMTITTDMVKHFAEATGDWNPIHFDPGKSSIANEECSSRVDGSERMNRTPIVHGGLLNGIVSGVIGTQLPGPGTVVVSQVFNFSAPLPVGSQVAVEVEVMNCRRREVNVRYKIVLIPGGTVVMDGTARLMVPRGRIEKVS